MKKYLFLSILALFQLASCQLKDKKQPVAVSCPKEGFCIQDSLLFYNGKKIEISTDINSLIPVLGKYDRVIEDKWGDLTNTDWLWFKEKHFAYHNSEDSLITFKNMKNNKYEKYKTIEEITTKYGMYDSVNVKYRPLRAINCFYSWDRLGIQATSTNDTLNSIYLYMNSEEKRSPRYNNRQPQGKYTGKVSINGVILDLAERKTFTWKQQMKALGISGKEHSLPGDSKDWYRVKETPYFILIFERNGDILDKFFRPGEVIPDYIKIMRIGFRHSRNKNTP